MEFVVLILVLMLRALLSLLPSKRHDRWFLALKAKALDFFKPKAAHLYEAPDTDSAPDSSTEAESHNPTAKEPAAKYSPAKWFAGTGAFFVAVILPVAALSLILSVLEETIWGLPAFALSILVLLYSLGRKESAYWLTRFQIAWRQKDLQGAFQYASEVLPQETIQDEKQLYQKVFSRLIGINFQDFFLVTFWFMVLGAEGALLARLMILFCDTHYDTQAETNPLNSSQAQYRQGVYDKIHSVQYLFEWLPAKLMGLSFMLTGHFVYCSQQWLGNLFNKSQPHEIILTRFALGALGEKVQDTAKATLQEAQDNAHKEEQLQELDGLLRRSSVLWVVAIAVTVVLMQL